MAKKEQLADIIKCCERRFNRGAATGWRHSDFLDLSRDINEEAEVIISPNTLKRIFGKIAVDDDYLPQQATIEALKKYGRYSPQEIKLPFESSQTGRSTINQKPGTAKSYMWLFIAASIVLVIILLLALGSMKFNKPATPGSISLNSTEGILPATAFFDLQTPNQGDSLFIDFGDKSPVLYVKPGERRTAHNYLFPGVFTVTLRSRKKDIASTRVPIKSNRWIGLSFRRQMDIPNQYYEFPAEKHGQDGLFHIENSQLEKMGLDTVGTFFTRLCNFTPVGDTSGDFIFEATFKNVLHEKGIYCNGTQFQVSGINSMIRFKLVNAGCSYRILNVLSEKTFEGSKDNLSQFVFDLEKWNSVKLINQNKQVLLFVNNKLSFTGTYKKSIGQIQGVFLEFEGNGFVKYCTLKSLDGKILYRF